MNPDRDSDKMTSIGLCLGASTISLVSVEQCNKIEKPPVGIPQRRITKHAVHNHNGNPKNTLHNLLAKINPSPALRITVTGRKFRKFVNITSVSEPEAVEYAYR